VETTITPMLSVQDAAAAIEFYAAAFGATVVERSQFGETTVAELAIASARFFVVTEDPSRGNVSPRTIDDRTSVRIDLLVDDPDAVAARAVAAGAREMFPVADQPYGLRQGRVVDPEGHHWLIGKPLAA
jgi:PhnB protein